MNNQAFVVALHGISVAHEAEWNHECTILPYSSGMYGRDGGGVKKPTLKQHALVNLTTVEIEDEADERNVDIKVWEPIVDPSFGTPEECQAEMDRCRVINVTCTDGREDDDEDFGGDFADYDSALAAVRDFFPKVLKKAKVEAELPRLISFESVPGIPSLRFLVIGAVRVPMSRIDSKWFVTDVSTFREALALQEPVLGQFKVFASALTTVVTTLDHALSDLDMKVTNHTVIDGIKRNCNGQAMVTIGPSVPSGKQGEDAKRTFNVYFNLHAMSNDTRTPSVELGEDE